MDKLERKTVLEFGAAVFFLVCNIEDLLEEYECDDELTDKQLSETRKKIRVVREHEKELKKVLGIEVE